MNRWLSLTWCVTITKGYCWFTVEKRKRNRSCMITGDFGNSNDQAYGVPARCIHEYNNLTKKLIIIRYIQQLAIFYCIKYNIYCNVISCRTWNDVRWSYRWLLSSATLIGQLQKLTQAEIPPFSPTFRTSFMTRLFHGWITRLSKWQAMPPSPGIAQMTDHHSQTQQRNPSTTYHRVHQPQLHLRKASLPAR